MRILIAGGGQVGTLIARRLIAEGNEIAIVDASAARCAELEASLDARIVHGSAARVATMHEAGIAGAEMVIAVTESDEVNLLACLIATVDSKARTRVARLRTYDVEHWRRVTQSAGIRIDLIIHPESDAADRLVRVAGIPGVSEIFEFAGGEVTLVGMHIPPGNRVAGKSLQDLMAEGPPSESLIAMIFRGPQVIVPHGPEVLREGDHVYVIASRASAPATLRFMGLSPDRSLDRAFVLGGRQVGILVAERLEKQGVQVKLFERDAAQSERAARLLERTVVIQADGTDQARLTEAGIEQADAFLALTNHDEDNVIASLLARRLGVPKVAALVNRVSYLSLVQRLGISTAVSPRLVAVDRILQFVRRGRVLSVTTFREEEAEAIELIATRDSKYVNRPLRDLRFPRGALVGAIVRAGSGGVVVPRGNDSIGPGDRVIVFALESVVPQMEAAFAGGRKNEP